jgi:hypothetical protein
VPEGVSDKPFPSVLPLDHSWKVEFDSLGVGDSRTWPRWVQHVWWRFQSDYEMPSQLVANLPSRLVVWTSGV